MTGVTGRSGLNMAVGLAGSSVAIVATRTASGDPTVIERNSLPTRLRGVAGVAGRSGLDMAIGFAGGRVAIVAGRTGTADSTMVKRDGAPVGL